MLDFRLFMQLEVPLRIASSAALLSTRIFVHFHVLIFCCLHLALLFPHLFTSLIVFAVFIVVSLPYIYV